MAGISIAKGVIMISYEAFRHKCRNTKVRNIDAGMLDLLSQIAYRQIKKGRWTHGNPVEIFEQDQYPCIRYQDGMAWHYDLVKGRWF